jgi:hypothetical protein
MARSAAPHLSLIIGHEALFRRNGALLALVRAAREQGAETSALAYSAGCPTICGRFMFNGCS